MRNLVKAIFIASLCSTVLFGISCQRRCSFVSGSVYRKGKVKMSIDKQIFGKLKDGRQVELYNLTNANGLRARITNYGGIVVSLEVPDKNGKLGDVTLGFDNLDDYLKGHPYFGAIVGRYGNRMGKARFVLNGIEYKLAANDGENHLHGGIKGFDKVLWTAQPLKEDDAVGLKLEEGYPGNLSCTVTYRLTNNDELKITYEAVTDKPTPVNLTHHSYFNLAGQGKRDILDHVLMINADKFTPVDKGLIPTGELRPVKDTPMDFTKPTPIGARINQDYQQLKFAGGYDHNWVLNKNGQSMSLAVRVYEPSTGRVMEVYTTEPGLQFYSGNFLDGSITGKCGRVYKHRYGFCLETQHFPDSPNKPNFPSVILEPGEKYYTETIYKFYTRQE